MPRRLPTLVFASGVIFSLYLQTLIPGEVYTTGDAGLKALLTHQLSRGDWHFDLRLPAEPWVGGLWDGGLYPFPFPNVVSVDEKRFITFPFTFPLLSAPFYRFFGFRGLYILPLVSLWLVWASFGRACRGLRLGAAVTAASLGAVVFASPLTWYSATFWEHTLAVALAFQGIAMALASGDGRRSAGASIAAGALIGASVSLREEMLFMVGLMAGLAIAAPFLEARGREWLSVRPRWFLLGLILAPALFFLANRLVYGHLLGLHGAGAVGALARIPWRVATAALRDLLIGLVRHFPVLLIGALGVPLLHATGRRAALGKALALLVLSVCFSVAVPLLVRSGGGRQWGPRYLLVTVPMLALAAGLTLERMREEGRAWRWAAWSAFVALFLWGAWVNAYQGTAYLRRNYQRRMVPYLEVRDDDARFVVVSHESVAAQLAATFERKTYFLANHAMDLRLLARELARHGETRFLYLCYPLYGCGPLGEGVKELSFYTAGGRPFARFSSRGAFDRYVVYDVACQPKAATGQ